MTSLSPAFLETHLLYLTHRLLKDQSKDVLSKLIATATGSARCQLHVNQTLYSLLVIGSHFPHDHVHQFLCLFPEILVHCQVNEEVADVVAVVEVHDNLIRKLPVNCKEQWYEADDVDDCDEDKLHHCHHVTSVVGSRAEQCTKI